MGLGQLLLLMFDSEYCVFSYGVDGHTLVWYHRGIDPPMKSLESNESIFWQDLRKEYR